MMLLSATMYIFSHQRISEIFSRLGYPTYIIYPLAIAKVLGVIAIVTKKSELLKEWAYAGFSFDFTLAFFANLMASEGAFAVALIALVLLIVSYVFGKRVGAG